ncbi:sugar transferase, partial [Mycobacterium sp. ITM-2017-0098]
MKTAVVTVVHGRASHLRNQLLGLQNSGRAPDLHVIVAIDDHTVQGTVSGCGARATVVHCRGSGAHLPVAHARNIGARTALERGAEVLVFLDV